MLVFDELEIVRMDLRDKWPLFRFNLTYTNLLGDPLRLCGGLHWAPEKRGFFLLFMFTKVQKIRSYKNLIGLTVELLHFDTDLDK